MDRRPRSVRRFAVTVNGLGSYDLQVAGRLSASGQDDTSHLTVTIKPGGILSGNVEDESGQALANVPVQVWAKGGGWLAATPMQLAGGPLHTAYRRSLSHPSCTA